MLELLLIGIGAGNPRHLTLQAIDAMRSADVILIPNKGAQKDDLAALRRQICAEHLGPDGPVLREFDLPVRDAATADYRTRVDDWHDVIAEIWQAEIMEATGGTGRVGFLVWGDPSLYDSTMRIAERLQRRMKLTLTVIPGITAIQSLTAGHAITLNEIGAPVQITTGRQIRDHGWPDGADTVVVMLDAGGAFQALDPDGVEIWWSAYAGMAEEIRITGLLAQVGPQIVAARAEARARHGWIMDIYLMRRTR
ncbi:precorrin-6A synthase (deacetylating) [Actibacterium ureilyticum]|uniref:precorrin-6A synthase (deacetylating) n=1 Tax=Actibacterium ureilyticum TaxID=1590614 RepID=UPI000BAB1D93|nr:precorrin-6A synthase (deacetylating) [Actibacterium ureilyticum]